MRKMLAGLLAGVLLLSGCTVQAAAKSDDTAAVAQQPAENAAVQGGFTENQTLECGWHHPFQLLSARRL